LIEYALNHPPSLVIDCANCANPHKFYTRAPYENFKKTYVIAVDAIYRFRDTLKSAGQIADKLGVKTIIITSYKYLYNFNDEEEVQDVIAHCKEIISELNKKYLVLVKK